MSTHRVPSAAAVSLFCLGLFSAALVAVPARAQDDDQDDTIVLPTKGINLASASGQAEMMSRVERAAREVCDESNRVSSEDRALFKECHDFAVADASRQMRVLIARAGKSSVLVADAARPPR